MVSWYSVQNNVFKNFHMPLITQHIFIT